MYKQSRSRAAVFLCSTLLLFASVFTAGQQTDDPAAPLRKEHWNGAVFVGGGNGLMDRTDVHMVRGGLRVGRVLTGVHSGGTFEIDAEFAPVDYTLWDGYKNVYGASLTPLVMKWNFVGNKPRSVVPFVEAAGGMLFSSENIPPGDTSSFNFTTGAGVGFHFFTRERRAVTFDVRAIHLSNASLGNHNPGINASVQMSLAYTWFRR
jgi:lipid A 3-O-deacylase